MNTEKIIPPSEEAAPKPLWVLPSTDVMPVSLSRNSHPLKPDDVTGGPGYS